VDVPDNAQLQHETGNNADIQNKGFTEDIDYKRTVPFPNVKERKNNKAKAYQHLGNAAAANSEYKKAVEYYEKAHKICPDLNADQIEGTAYQWLGYNLLQAGHHQEAIKYYSEVVKYATQVGDKNMKLNAYLGLGSAFNNTGDGMSSRKYYLKALTIAKLSPDKRLQGEVHTNLGHVYYQSCMLDAALKSYHKAQEIFADLGEFHENANVCLMLAHTFRQLKEHEKAIEYYKKALRINESRKGEGYGKCLEGIINEWCGYCCRLISGKHEEAITFYFRAKEIAKRNNNLYQEYRTNKAVGNIFWNTDNVEKAKTYHEQALENAKKLHDKHCEGTSYLDLASVYSKEFDYEMARKLYERALCIFGIEHVDYILKEKALVGLGIAWFNLGNTQKATKSIQSAQEVAEAETHKGIFLANNIQNFNKIHTFNFSSNHS
jgi:tetratricopeptide (TPR) repeat protein